MYNNYKLKSGKELSVFALDSFKTCLCDREKCTSKKLDGYEIDFNGSYISNLFHVDLLKNDKGFYFVYDDEIVYINDYLFFSIKELINKIRYDSISIDEFIRTLKKESRNIVIIEKIPYINNDIIDIKEVACKLVDDKFKESLWLYNIEIEPIDEENKKIYGNYRYYVSDLYFFIKTGYFKIFEKKEYLKSLNECKKRVLKK